MAVFFNNVPLDPSNLALIQSIGKDVQKTFLDFVYVVQYLWKEDNSDINDQRISVAFDQIVEHAIEYKLLQLKFGELEEKEGLDVSINSVRRSTMMNTIFIGKY